MAYDLRSSKSFGAADRTVNALKFHTERVREKTSDMSTASDHNQILGKMVDLHHRNMSMVRASLLKHDPLEPRTSNTTIDEVDTWSDDEGDGEEEPVPDARASLQNVPSTRSDAQDPAVPSSRAPCPATSKKPMHELDPVTFHRQMRQATMSRCASQQLPSSLKGAYALLSPPSDEDDEGAGGPKVDLSTLRSKSFLARPDHQAGATYDMLAQIRGSKWMSDDAASKGSKSMPAKGTDSFVLPSSRSGDTGVLSTSLPSLSPGVPPAGLALGAKSFSAVTRSGGKGFGGALPRVSVDSSPALSRPTELDRLPGRHTGVGGSTGGFLSRLKHMMKH